MTTPELEQIVRETIATAAVDPVTLKSSAKSLLDFYQANPELQAGLDENLVKVVDDFAFQTEQQLRNAAYLIVNLDNVPALRRFLARTSTEPALFDDERISLVIAAIRTLPSSDAIRDELFPSLFRWLSNAAVADLAFETLCDLYPDDCLAIFAELVQYQSTNEFALNNAITHIYFQGGDTVRGDQRVGEVLHAIEQLYQRLLAHPFLPEAMKLSPNLGATHAPVSSGAETATNGHRTRPVTRQRPG